MKKRLSLPALVVAVAIAGFLTLIMAPKSFAAAQASKTGVSFSLSGQYIGRAIWAQNQAEVFISGQNPTSNSFDVFLQRLRMNASVSYDMLANGMPLAAVFTQFDLTNAYNGTTSGLGSNGWEALGYNPVPNGFNHDLNTFGLRQAYIRFITPIGAIMFGRMPVKFGLGIAVNTNADGIGDFIPLSNVNVGIFAGNLFGNETAAYETGATPTPINIVPPAITGYSHIQSGTIPTIEVMSLKPVNNVSWSAWLTEAHLSQFGAQLSTIQPIPPVPGVIPYYSPTTTLSNNSISANITYGGLSATYAAKGTYVAGEFDYFRGDIMNSPYIGNITTDDRTKIGSYDFYLKASQLLNTSIPLSVGFKFGIGGPISYQHLDMTYYSQIQNTRTFFGNVIGNNWQPIEFAAPGLGYMYSNGIDVMGSNLANRYVIMVDAKQFLGSGNSLRYSLIHAAWLKTSVNGTDVFGGHTIGTEFDLNFTHHFAKTLAWQAWGAYVWTGSGVESAPFATAAHKNITALGSAIIWNF